MGLFWAVAHRFLATGVMAPVGAPRRRAAALLQHLSTSRPSPCSAGSAGPMVVARDGDGWAREIGPDPAAPPHPHRLTAAQEETFRTEGFLLLRNIIPPNLVVSALDAVDQMIYEYEQQKPAAHGGKIKPRHRAPPLDF